MSVCSRCPYGLTFDNGTLRPEWRGKSYHAMPCATCNLGHAPSVLGDRDRSNHSRTPISLDATTRGDGQDFEDAERTGWGKEYDGGKTDTQRRAFSELLTQLGNLPQVELVVTMRRLAGASFARVGMERGKSRQWAHQQYQAAERRVPVLAVAFPDKGLDEGEDDE